MPFDDMWADAVVKDYDGVKLRIASIPHLIAMKKIAGRPRDLNDITELTKNCQQNESSTVSVKANPQSDAHDADPLSCTFEQAEERNLIANINASTRAKVEFFEEMIMIGVKFGALITNGRSLLKS